MPASVASSVWWGLARSRSLSLAVASAARRCNGIQQQHARVARCCESQYVIKGKDQLVARTAAAMYRQRVNIHNPDVSVTQRSASHWQCSRCLPSTRVQVHVAWPWQMCSTAPLIIPNNLYLSIPQYKRTRLGRNALVASTAAASIASSAGSCCMHTAGLGSSIVSVRPSSFLLRSFSTHRHSFGVCCFVKSKSLPPEPWNDRHRLSGGSLLRVHRRMQAHLALS